MTTARPKRWLLRSSKGNAPRSANPRSKQPLTHLRPPPSARRTHLCPAGRRPLLYTPYKVRLNQDFCVRSSLASPAAFAPESKPNRMPAQVSRPHGQFRPLLTQAQALIPRLPLLWFALYDGCINLNSFYAFHLHHFRRARRFVGGSFHGYSSPALCG